MATTTPTSTSTIFRTCPLCEATCGLAITHDGERVLKITGDAEDVFSKGFICPKGAVLGQLDADPDRLKTPLIRRGGNWEAVDWETALDEVAAKIHAVQAEHGQNAVAVYLGNPSAHTLSGTLYNRALIKALATRQIYSASTVDQMPKHLASGLMFGSPFSIAVPDVDRTDFMLMLGANPWVSNGSLATAPDWPGRLRALRRRGGRLVVVDPLRTQTADHADEHLAIRPGADAWLLAALVYTLFDEGLVRDGRLTDVTSGRDVIERATRPFSPERVADACGLTSTAIRDLARAFARAERAVCYARIGTCTQQFGSLATWLVDVLNALTNNLDEPGGAMFSMAAHEPRRPERSAGGRGFEIGRWNSRIYDAPEVLGEFPVATLNDEIRTSGEGQIKALLTVAGNPVLSTPNGPALAESLAQLNFMVSIDPYLNETTRHAHVILPPPPPLTRSHYDISFYGFALRRVANFSAPVWAAAPEAMPEWQIVMGLVGRLSGQTTEVEAVDDFLCRQMVSKEVNDKRSPLHGRSVDALMKELGDRRGPDRMIDFLLRAGVYGDGFGADPDGLSLDKLLAHPHGIDFGPLVPRLPDMLTTKSGRIELAPPLLLKDLDRLAQQLDETPPELVLIGRRHLRSNNSWMHNVPGLMTGRPRCTALIHPDDAAKAGVSDGEQAQLRSSTGTISVIVEIDEAIRPGVVSVPHGWGHDDEQTRLSVARQTPGTNVNELASTEAWDPLSGNAILNGVPVALTALC